MSFEIQNLQDIDPALVTQELAQISAMIQELHPEVDLRRGVLHDVLLYYHAVLASGERTNLNRYLSARSLLQVNADPTLADGDVVDQLFSNWGISRQQGTRAQGEVVIVLTDDTSVTFSSGTVFVANGRQYVTTQLFSAVTEESMIRSSADRLLTALTDGTFAFTVTVEAVNAGSGYGLSKDTLILPVNPPTGLKTAYAASDFTAGTDTETNDNMLRRLQQGIAAKGGANRVNYLAWLRSVDAFSNIPEVSIIGYGDPEMLRDQHSIIPIKYGGRVDWYVRSQNQLSKQSFTKTATLISKGSYGTWQFSVTRQEYPGFYEIRNIRPADISETTGSFEIVNDIRAVDLTGTGFIPDIDTIEEGAYSAFQTTTIQFVDTLTDVTSLAVGATKSYAVEIVGMPLIGDLQTAVSGFEVRNCGADTLIKAAVPCFVQLHFTVYRRADDADPVILDIQEAVAAAVNQLGFTGKLYASKIIDAVSPYLSNGACVSEIDMLGRIRQPDGATVYLQGREVLTVPDVPARMVTANTVQFLLDPEDVHVAVATGLPTPI